MHAFLTFKRRSVAPWAVAGVILLGASLPLASSARASQTLTVSAGSESPGGDVQLNAFAPRTITISEGDSIVWRVDSAEFHTIHFLAGNAAPAFIEAGPEGVFLNPAATSPIPGASYDGSSITGSGLLTTGESYTLSFPKAGTYEYVCLIHPEMKGTVIVKTAGEAVDSQATVDARRSEEINAALATRGIPVVMSNVGELHAEGVSSGVAAGAGDHVVMVPRFFPQRLTVKAGDAVTWVWKDPEAPHTVTFLGGDLPPDLIIPQSQSDGPPRLQLNPVVLAPAGDPTSFDGGPLSSGFLDPAQMPHGNTPTFTVRFDQPGTYEYVCLLHEGMQGTVIVEA